ncbi:efflux RND transporter periplasmic adaptor subunit, partial [Myxococcota bacterium]|nr:efflux RND transporter periplasmic adaptor subunit [Myxococcota bacterium]
MKKERQTWKIRLARGYHLFLSVTPSLVAIIFLYAAVMSLPGSKEGKHRGHTHLESEKTAKEKKSESTAEIYTCSMHPSVRSFTPGKCPICGMDLILVAGDSSTGSWEISLTPRALALAAVETSRVVLRKPTNEVRLIGHVAYDEGREVKVASWVSGRIEHLYVNITGQKIRAYQPLMSIYSPELYTAQLELVRLLKSTGTNENQYLQGVITSGVESVKTKLRLLGMSGGQIRQVIRTRKAMERVVIYAPQGGTVTRRHVSLGSYVATGSPLISLSTEHKLWVFFDVQEKDLHLIRLGQGLTYSVDALKGLAFVGRVQFIDPLVDKATGTIRVRASVDNPEALLKEGMYIRGVAHTAELKALPSVPIQAVLYTGRRSVVYVKVPGKEAAFEGRQITIGARTGSYQLVLEGLREGEEVVTRGNFMIDSALQISARSSMMSHEGEQVREKDQGHG